jgi:hypothetical protein
VGNELIVTFIEPEFTFEGDAHCWLEVNSQEITEPSVKVVDEKVLPFPALAPFTFH